MEWVLILLVHVGWLGKTDSNSLVSVPGFSSVEECRAAGESSKQLVSGTKKELAYVCVQRKAKP